MVCLGTYPVISTSPADPSSISVNVVVSIAPNASMATSLQGIFGFTTLNYTNSKTLNFSGTPGTVNPIFTIQILQLLINFQILVCYGDLAEFGCS